MTDTPPTAPDSGCACRAQGQPCAPWCGRDPAQGHVVGIYLDPPMAIARVGRSPQPMDAYVWAMDENPHRGVQTTIRPAPSLWLSSVHGNGHWPHRLAVVTPDRITFKDDRGRVRPVAPFFDFGCGCRTAAEPWSPCR